MLTVSTENVEPIVYLKGATITVKTPRQGAEILKSRHRDQKIQHMPSIVIQKKNI
jgi:hypothetical protein